MKQSFVLMLGLAVLPLIGCDQISSKHDIVRAGNQTFLLDRSTGETKLIDGTSLVEVKSPDPAAANEPFKRAKTWNEQSINDLQGVKFKLRTKYRDGAMLWSVEAGPFSGSLEREYKTALTGILSQPTVLFELYDEEGFRTGEAIELKLRLGSRTVNEKNEVISLGWTGTQAMSTDTYRAAAFVSTRWYGFGKE